MQARTPEAFFDAVKKLRSIPAEQTPHWGSMSPQHMVEHLVGSWRISNGNARVKTFLSEEEVERRRVFLFSEQSYPKNLPNPLFKEGLQPLRKADLTAAIDQLEMEMKDFFAFHPANPGAIEIHPVFGPLDYEGWMLFQTKHMAHHLAQFGIVF